MKKLILALVLLAASSHAAHVQFYFADFTASTPFLTNRVLLVQPTNSTPRASGNSIITSDRLSYTNDGSASVTISNMVTATYHCVIRGPFKDTAFQITVPDTNAVLNAKDLLSVNTNSPPGSVGYSMTSADGLFVKKFSSWSSGQTLTNATFAGSTNFFRVPTNDVVQGSSFAAIDTNGNVFAAIVTSGGGGGNSDAITNISDAANSGISLIYTSNNFTIKLVTLSAGTGVWITNNGTNLVIASTGTNGLSTIDYVNLSTNGHVTSAITNGLATISYVDGSRVWTNDGQFIYWSGQLAVVPSSATPGPMFFFSTNGSIFIGQNVNQDANALNLSYRQYYDVSFTSSNEPAHMLFSQTVVDSEDYNYWAYWSFDTHGDATQGRTSLDITARLLNGNHGLIILDSDPAHLNDGTAISISTNGNKIFQAGEPGFTNYGPMNISGTFTNHGVSYYGSSGNYYIDNNGGFEFLGGGFVDDIGSFGNNNWLISSFDGSGWFANHEFNFDSLGNLESHNILPRADNTYSLGSTTKQWDKVWTRNLAVDTVNSTVDNLELGYLDGVTSGIQGQLNLRQIGNATLSNMVAGIYNLTNAGIYSSATTNVPIKINGIASAITNQMEFLSNGTRYAYFRSNYSLMLPDGIASAPAIGFASDDDGTGTGFYRNGANVIGVSANGVLAANIGGTGISDGGSAYGFSRGGTAAIVVWNGANIGWASGSAAIAGTAIETGWFRDGAGDIAQRSGTIQQTNSVYGTYTSATSGEKMQIGYNGTHGWFFLQSNTNGAGTLRPLSLGVTTNSSITIDVTRGVTVKAALTNTVGLSIGPSGGLITNVLTGSANLDFPSTGPATNSDLSITVTGATTNDVATVQVPPIAWLPNASFHWFCSNDTVWVRFINNGTNGGPSLNPGPVLVRAKVDKF